MVVSPPCTTPVRDHVARVADEHGPVPQRGKARDLLDHLGVVVGGQGLLPRAAVRHRQPAHEVGHPGVGRPLELGILVQEVVDVPGLVAHPQVEGLVLDEVGEDHEVADQDLVHGPDGLEGVQVVLGRLTLDVPRFAGQKGRGRVDPFGAPPQQFRDRVLGQPVHLEAGPELTQLVGDGQVTAGMAETDGRGNVEHPFGPGERPGPGARDRRGLVGGPEGSARPEAGGEVPHRAVDDDWLTGERTFAVRIPRAHGPPQIAFPPS